jgi:cupin fold WbuC family metalloprotein
MELIIPELGLVRDIDAKTESYFCEKNQHLILTEEHVQQLKNHLVKTNNYSVRINLHRSSDDIFHQMIIIHRKGGLFRPHKHLYKEESHHIIEGKLRINIYNSDGTIKDSTVLCLLEPGLPMIFRLRENTWHETIPESEFAIFHESKPGPFLSNDSIFPNW